MTSYVNKDVSIYQGIVLPLWMCWPCAPISHLMPWVQNKGFTELLSRTVWRTQAETGLHLGLLSISAALVKQLLPCLVSAQIWAQRLLYQNYVEKVFSIILWTKEAFQRLVLGLWSRKSRFPNKRKVTDFSDTVWNSEHLCQRMRSSEVVTHNFWPVPRITALYPTHSPLLGAFRRCALVVILEQSKWV